MFWGITLENGKRYSQTVEVPFHVSMAALEKSDGSSKNTVVSVKVEHENSEFLLCSLQHGGCYQQQLDLNFVEGEVVTFFTNGEGTVHLTGYLANDLDELDDDSELLEFDEDDDSDETEDEKIGDSNKRKMVNTQTKNAKKKRMTAAELMEMDDLSDEDDSEEEKMKSPKKQKTPAKQEKTPKNQKQATVNSESTPAAKRAERKKKQKGQSGGAGDAEVKSILVSNKSKETPKNKSLLNGKQEKTVATTPDAGTSSAKKKKNKKKRKNSLTQLDTTQAQSPVSLPGTPAAIKQPNFQTPKSEARKLQGGTVVEDIVQGNGPVAKKGRFVHISYVGKLTNNKVFDSSRKDPLGFRLGAGEVIKGMDIGVEGMKVGGKRKITIPSHQAYGKESKGGIPSNSTLIFDIELKSIK